LAAPAAQGSQRNAAAAATAAAAAATNSLPRLKYKLDEVVRGVTASLSRLREGREKGGEGRATADCNKCC